MRNITLAIAALAAIAFALPVTAASAEDAVVIKTHRDHDHDWYRRHHKKIVVIGHDRDRDHDWYRRHHQKVVILKRHHNRDDND
jgi:hypothetical protein